MEPAEAERLTGYRFRSVIRFACNICRAFAVATIISLSICGILAQTADPSIGTWKLNLSKSTFDPGPAPKSQTLRFENRGEGIYIVTTERVDAQGRPTFTSYTVKFDGREWPTGANSQTGSRNTTSYKLVDLYTLEITQKVNALSTASNRTVPLVTTTLIRKISPDAKTMAFTSQGTKQVLVFDKQ